MSRQDRTREDTENYAVMTCKMQMLGENLYQQLQNQSAPTVKTIDENYFK